jgi:hypothetical protein
VRDRISIRRTNPCLERGFGRYRARWRRGTDETYAPRARAAIWLQGACRAAAAAARCVARKNKLRCAMGTVTNGGRDLRHRAC